MPLTRIRRVATYVTRMPSHFCMQVPPWCRNDGGAQQAEEKKEEGAEKSRRADAPSSAPDAPVAAAAATAASKKRKADEADAEKGKEKPSKLTRSEAERLTVTALKSRLTGMYPSLPGLSVDCVRC